MGQHTKGNERRPVSRLDVLCATFERGDDRFVIATDAAAETFVGGARASSVPQITHESEVGNMDNE